MRRLIPLLIFPLLALPAGAADTRRDYDGSGKLVHEMVLEDGSLVSETTWTFEGSVWVEKVTVAGERREVVSRSYEGGKLVEEVQTVNDRRVSRTAWVYEGDKLVEETRVDDGASRTTRYEYDGFGHVVRAQTLNGAGETVDEQRSTYAAPRVPIAVSATAGNAFASDVELTSLAAGFAVARAPDASLWDVDPLEVRADVTYQLGRSQGVTTQNQLDASFGLDLNHLVGKTTFFLFTTLQRDPVSNLNLDLVVAPVGVKYDFLGTSHFLLDGSFAPVWNYRSIVAPGATCDGAESDTDTICASSKLRGSFRVRAELTTENLELSDTVEYLPNLIPEGGDFAGALADDSIFRNTAGLAVKLSSTLSLGGAFVFERDPSLAAQADCDADPDNLLCDGLIYTTTNTLTYTQSF